MRKKWLFTISITIIFVVAVFSIKYDMLSKEPKEILKKDTFGVALTQNIGEIDELVTLEQDFLAESNNIRGVNIFFSTFNRENKGNTLVEIIELNTDEVVREVLISNASIQDNTYKQILFDPISNSKGKGFSIRLSSNGTNKDNSVTVWVDQIEIKNSQLRVSNIVENGIMVAEVIYQKKFELSNFMITLVFFIMLNILLVRMIMFLRR